MKNSSWRDFRKSKIQNRGNMIIVSVALIALFMAFGVALIKQSQSRHQTTEAYAGHEQSKFTYQGAFEIARARLQNTFSDLSFGDLEFLALKNEFFPTGADPVAKADEFLRGNNGIKGKARKKKQPLEPFDWQTSLKETMTWFPGLPTSTQVAYTLTPRGSRYIDTDIPTILFDYDYKIQVRSAYSSSSGSEARNAASNSNSEDVGTFTIKIQNPPFSQWAVFYNKSVDSWGYTVVPSGDRMNTSTGAVASIGAVYDGAVHMNEAPILRGRVQFLKGLTSAATSAEVSIMADFANRALASGGSYPGKYIDDRIFDGVFGATTDATITTANLALYPGNPVFGKEGLKTKDDDGIEVIDMPHLHVNVERMALRTADYVADLYNTDPIDDLHTALMFSQNGVLGGNPHDPVPEGIYIPLNAGRTDVIGGIYVLNNSSNALTADGSPETHMFMDVVDLNADYVAIETQANPRPQLIPAQLDALRSKADLTNPRCRLQVITHDFVPPNQTHIVLPGRDCRNSTTGGLIQETYIFANGSSTMQTFGQRWNGVIYVSGILNIGGVSRYRAAVARDMIITIAARKNIRIVNDLQYEDAQYASVDATGIPAAFYDDQNIFHGTAYNLGDTSTLDSISDDVSPLISPNSKTLLGLISTDGSIRIASDPANPTTMNPSPGLPANAPNGINIHASTYAGSTGCPSNNGCGVAKNDQTGAQANGCGFGVENVERYTIGAADGCVITAKLNGCTGTAVDFMARTRGRLKLLGSRNDFRPQRGQQVITCKNSAQGSVSAGYTQRFTWDKRLARLSPPAFPLTGKLKMSSEVVPFRAWRDPVAESHRD